MNIEKLEYYFFKVLNEACDVFNIKQASFTKLFEDINFQDTENNQDIPKYTNNNKYAYGLKLKEYFNYHLENDKDFLFESINRFNIHNSIKFNQVLEKLDKSIKNLEKINDFNVLDVVNPTIVKTKIFMKKPILIFGFDIMNSFNFQNILYDKFKITMNNVIEIYYAKSDYKIIYVFEKFYIIYDIKENQFSKEESKQSLNDLFGNNLLLLHKKFQTEIKFVDNLYSDNFKQSVLQQIENQKNLVR